MNVSDFKIKEDEFIFELLNSSVYKNYLENKRKLENDEYLIFLSKKRNEFFLKANEEKDENKKREYLISFSQLTDEIKESDLYQEYFIEYKKIKEVLDIINKNILEKLK